MELFQPLFDPGSDDTTSGASVPDAMLQEGASASGVKQRLIEQIKRDMRVLQEDPIYYHVPGREFYEDRIASFRRELTRETT